jgi:hypothetical protein
MMPVFPRRTIWDLLSVSIACLAVIALSPGCFRRPASTAASARQTTLEAYPRFDDPDAFVFDDLPVKLYFHSQAPPPGTTVIQPVRARSTIVARNRTCREAGLEGLRKLQRIAIRYGADAVVNIRATWQGEQLGDDLVFDCIVIEDKYTLIWEGALAKTPDPPEPPAPEAGGAMAPSEAGTAASARLRELDSLYYQGLITRDEYLERRRRILDEL